MKDAGNPPHEEVNALSLECRLMKRMSENERKLSTCRFQVDSSTLLDVEGLAFVRDALFVFGAAGTALAER